MKHSAKYKRFVSAIRFNARSHGITQSDASETSGLDQGSISRWLNYKATIPEMDIVPLGKAFNVDESITNALLNEISGNQPIETLSLNQLLRKNYSLQEVLSEIGNIYDSYPVPVIKDPELGSNDYGDPEKWDAIIAGSPESFFVANDISENKIAGYCFAIAISDEIYKQGKAGRNINANLQPSDSLGFTLPNDSVNMYLVDLFKKKGYDSHIVFKNLLEHFQDFLISLAKSEIYVDRILTHASEVLAETMCFNMGFEPGEEHHFHRRYVSPNSKKLTPTKMYELKLFENLESNFFRHAPELAEIYKSKMNSM